MSDVAELSACLPADLRSPSTTITKIAAGLSGAAVHRVEAAGRVFVLKISAPDEPLEGWRQKVHIRRIAADAGLAPRVAHVDEARRAVLSDFVVDRSFPALYWDPRTREAALTLLGRTLRRVHDLPVPPDASPQTALGLLMTLWSGPLAHFALPAFVGDAVRGVLAEAAPESDRPPVLSHNDVNPTNLVYDGENILLLDWETAGANDPFYDLAAISVFLRLTEEACLTLLAAHDGERVSSLPARFAYNRRVVAALCGAAFLHLARQNGHAGATGAETLESAPSLGDVYQRLRAGSLSVASADGQWGFGLALIRESVSL